MPNGDLKLKVVALLQVTRQKTSQNKAMMFFQTLTPPCAIFLFKVKT